MTETGCKPLLSKDVRPYYLSKACDKKKRSSKGTGCKPLLSKDVNPYYLSKAHYLTHKRRRRIHVCHMRRRRIRVCHIRPNTPYSLTLLLNSPSRTPPP